MRCRPRPKLSPGAVRERSLRFSPLTLVLRFSRPITNQRTLDTYVLLLACCFSRIIAPLGRLPKPILSTPFGAFCPLPRTLVLSESSNASLLISSCYLTCSSSALCVKVLEKWMPEDTGRILGASEVCFAASSGDHAPPTSMCGMV